MEGSTHSPMVSASAAVVRFSTREKDVVEAVMPARCKGNGHLLALAQRFMQVLRQVRQASSCTPQQLLQQLC